MTASRMTLQVAYQVGAYQYSYQLQVPVYITAFICIHAQCTIESSLGGMHASTTYSHITSQIYYYYLGLPAGIIVISAANCRLGEELLY